MDTPMPPSDEEGVGIVLGASGVVDVDLDSPEAEKIGTTLLPLTATYGRGGRKRHCLYICPSETRLTWVDPSMPAKDGMILELRGGRHLTILPGPYHPKGDPPTWCNAHEPAAAMWDDLKRSCDEIAIATVISRFLGEGTGHDGALAIAGALRSANWPRERVESVVEAICSLRGDPDVADRLKAVHSTYESDGPLAGWGALARLGAAEDRLQALRKWAGVGGGTRAVIRLTDDISHAIDQVTYAVAKAGLFQSGGEVSRVRAGQIQRLSPDSALDEISRLCAFVRGDKPTKPPTEVVRGLLARAGDGLPVLRGVTRLPILRRDGTLCTTQGYDALSQWYYAGPSAVQLPSPKEGLEALFRVTAKSWWETPADQVAWVSHVLTHVARHLVDPVPLFVYSANAAGSGKTTLAQAACEIATGRRPGACSARPGTDEWQRALFAAANDDALLLDNVRGIITSVELEQALLSGALEARKYHSQDTIRRPWRAVCAITANGAVLSGDLPRRTMPVRLDCPSTNIAYEGDLDLPDGLALGALAFLSDYLSRTEGGVWEGRSWQSYSAWVKTIAGSLKWAGHADLVLHREAAMEDMAPDAVSAAQVVRLLRELCIRSERVDKGITAREICAETPKAAGGLDAPLRRALLIEIKENLGLKGPEELTVRKCNTYLKSLGTTAEGKLVCKTVEGYLRWRVV